MSSCFLARSGIFSAEVGFPVHQHDFIVEVTDIFERDPDNGLHLLQRVLDGRDFRTVGRILNGL
jgi:hypothetical protein